MLPIARADWFSVQFGFAEDDFEKTRDNGFRVEAGDNDGGVLLTSNGNKKQWKLGKFSTPSVHQLRESLQSEYDSLPEGKRLRMSIEQGDVQLFHIKPENNYATFQVASQLNCLEFVGPRVTPERGITCYAMDRTQGPACCLCTGPAVAYRNYFCGQSATKQLNLLYDAQAYLENTNSSRIPGERRDLLPRNPESTLTPTNSPSTHCKFVTVQGGYTESTSEALAAINWNAVSEDELIGRMRIGVHRDIPVLASGWGKRLLQREDQVVTHALCSAAAVGYSRAHGWDRLASDILEAAYEATVLTAFENSLRHPREPGAKKLFLTLVGGGVFGNRSLWIRRAIVKACEKYAKADLQVVVVSYGSP